MKVLIDARLYGLENAGLGRYVINLLGELAKIDSQNEYVILLRKKYFDRLKFPRNWQKVLSDFRHYSLIEQIRLPVAIARYKPDIVHFPHFNVPLFYSGPFVVTIHDLLMHRGKGKKATTLPVARYQLKRLAYWTVFRKAVKSSKKILVPSKTVKRELIDYYKIDKEKVIVTYEGVDKRIAVKKRASGVLRKYKIERQYFIYAGNAYPHKNIERAIEAVVQLKHLFAIVSARDVFTQRLQEHIRDLKAQKYVKLLGFVPDEELGVLLRNSVAFVYPSLSEGFGLPGLEAIAAGTLVLASDTPVFKEVYKDNVLYFNPLDLASIEKTMRKAIGLPEKEREKIIKKGQKFIKRYSWAKMAKQTLKVYESVLK